MAITDTTRPGGLWAKARARRAVRTTAAAIAVAGTVVCSLTFAAAASAAEPLRGKWHLDAPGNAAQPDASGNGNPANPVGASFTFASDGRFGGAYSFPNENSYFNAGNSPQLQPANVTVVAWVRRNGAPSAVKGIVSQGSAGSCSYSSYALYTGGSTNPNLKTRFYIWNGTTTASSPPVPDSMWNGAWHMLAGTYDGTAVRIYLDGAEVGSGTPVTGSIGYGLARHNNLLIGGFDDPACFEQTNFDGGIDEPRIYSRALNAGEIDRLADPAATSPPELPEPPPARRDPIASFRPTTLVPKPFAPVTFDASASVPGDDRLIRYDWDLTGDGKTDVSCGAETPVLTTNTLSSAVRKVGLSVVGASGARSSASQPVSVPKLTLPASTALALRATGTTLRLSGSSVPGGLCTPKAGQATRLDTTANGGPGPGCISQLIFGSFKATGCWRLNNDPESLPQKTLITMDKSMRPVIFGGTTPASGSVPAAIRLPPSRGGLAYGSLLNGKLKHPEARASASFVQYAQTMFAAVANNTFIADGPVRVNGLDVTPRRGGGGDGKIAFIGGGLLASAKAQLLSYGADVTASSPFGKLPMKSGELTERFGLSDSNSPLGALKIPSKFKLVPGLGIKGDVSAVMDHYKLKIGANVSLPSELGGVTSRADLTASVEKGLELDYFKLAANRAPLGPVILKNMNFEWRGPQKLLTAGLEATILYQIGAGGEIRFQNGTFRSLSVHAEASPGIALAPGVFLSALDAAYDTNGPVIKGGGTLTLGPNPGGGCPKAGIDGIVTLDFNYPITLSAVGATRLACFNVANMGAGINEEGYGYVFGRINPDLSPLPLTINAAVGGQIQVPINGKSLVFQIDGTAQACIDLGKPFKGCLPKADMTVTDRAFAACLDFGPFSAGLRLFYPPPASLANPVVFAAYLLKNFKGLAPGCNVGDYRPFPVKLARASGPQASAAAKTASFTLPAGRRGVVLAVHGDGDPPELVVKGPDGQVIDVPSHALVHNDKYAAFRLPFDDTTYVMLGKPAAGNWKIELKPGSPQIKSVESADALPPVKVTGTVRQAGDRRELSYRVGARRGQSVRFVETAGPKAGQTLGETTKSRGTIRFSPAQSRTRTHAIVAYVVQDGTPSQKITVARFQAALPAIGKAKIRVRRTRNRLAITWSAARNAQSYRVFVDLGDGRKLFFTPKARTRRVTVAGVAKRDRATITVIGERTGGRLGPKALARVKPVKRT